MYAAKSANCQIGVSFFAVTEHQPTCCCQSWHNLLPDKKRQFIENE